MSRLEELIQRIGKERGEDNPFPDDFEAYLEDFIPNNLLKSETLQIAFNILDNEMEEIYAEAYGLYQREEYRAASNGFRFLIILNPYRPRYWIGLGACLQLLQRYEKALQAYAIVTLLDSKNPAPHLYASEVYKLMGDEKEAAIALQLAKELQPC